LPKNSLNMLNIRLIFVQTLAQPALPSLRSPFSDRLLAGVRGFSPLHQWRCIVPTLERGKDG